MGNRRSRAVQPANGAITAGNTVEVGAIDDALAAALHLLMNSDLARPVPDTDLAARDRDRDTLADQAPRHRVAVGVDLDRAVVPDDARQLAQAAERRPSAQRLQPMRLVALEAGDRRLAGRAVHAHVRDIPLPPGKVRLERFPALKAVPGESVLLHVADPALGLALRARPV